MRRVKLTVSLIKEEYGDFESLMKEESVVEKYDLRNDLRLDGCIYVGSNFSNCPYWLELLEQGSEQEMSRLKNSSTRAVLLIRRRKRVFAFSFGFGRYMIKEEAIVRDFGMRVVLNSVDPTMLRSVDTAQFDELTVHSRTQTSRSVNVSAFNIDVVRDFLRALSGKPGNNDYGTTITGRDSVHFSYEFEDFGQFGDICDYLYERCNSDEYRAHFEWYDNLQVINDPVLLNTLETNLVERINARDENKFHLAPPEIVDWTDIGGFSYTEHGEVYEDLLVRDYFNYLKNREMDSDRLKRQKVYVWNSDGTDVKARWKLYDCIVFETEKENDVYVLTLGMWFKIETSFASSVRDYIRTIPESDIDLPLCREDEHEDIYNERVADERNDIICLDRIMASVDGSRFEICDLLSAKGQFVHVRPWRSSSTLSHLFSQGRVSAVSLFQDEQFRDEVRSKIIEKDSDFSHIVDRSSIDPAKLEIVFAIIDSDPRDLHDRLPFFSKLNMMHTVRLLSNFGFKVTKTKIAREAYANSA